MYKINHPLVQFAKCLCSQTRLCTVGWSTTNFHLDIHKIDNGHFQKWKIDSLFKKFSTFMVNKYKWLFSDKLTNVGVKLLHVRNLHFTYFI